MYVGESLATFPARVSTSLVLEESQFRVSRGLVENSFRGASDLPKEVTASKGIPESAEGIVTSAPRLKMRLLGASTQVPPEPRLTHLPQGRAASQRFAAWRQCTHCKTRATKTCMSRDCEYALTHRNRHPPAGFTGKGFFDLFISTGMDGPGTCIQSRMAFH